MFCAPKNSDNHNMGLETEERNVVENGPPKNSDNHNMGLETEGNRIETERNVIENGASKTPDNHNMGLETEANHIETERNVVENGQHSIKFQTITAKDFFNIEFETSEQFYEMYCQYAKCVGFGVRKGDLHRDDYGNLTHRRFFCNREGKRDRRHYQKERTREQKPETRTNCQAKLSVYLDRSTSSWKARTLIEEHNHDMTPLAFVHLIPNHRLLKESDEAQIDSMHKKARIIDGDANAAISYLQGKADSNPMSVAKYTSTDDGKLGNLLWVDGSSRADYQYFGDVLAFDATYKRNMYNRPLVIFSGTNNHRRTCIFGFALLIDETRENYKWLLENFLEAMLGKQPRVVVTDGDRAIREAIQVVFPDATHRLCGWHLQKNATTNLKTSGFCEALKSLIYENLEVEDFEKLWADNVEKCQLQDNEWVHKLYDMKEMWATAYLRGKFCTGFRTTSQCEEINSFINRFVRTGSILELVQNLERAVALYRNNELESQFKSTYGKPVLTTGLEEIERSAASLYTREILRDVKKQIEGVMSLSVADSQNIGTTTIYKVQKYGRAARAYIVKFDSNLDKYECNCQMLNGYGIPCSHMFCVMKHKNVLQIPPSLVLLRWRKDVKSYGGHQLIEGEEDSEKNVLIRYGALASASQWMSYLGAKRLSYFRSTMDEICRISTDLERRCGSDEGGIEDHKGKRLADPGVERVKGAPSVKKDLSKKRRCSSCNFRGHSKRTCPKVNLTSSRIGEDDNDLPTGSDDDTSSSLPQSDQESKESNIH